MRILAKIKLSQTFSNLVITENAIIKNINLATSFRVLFLISKRMQTNGSKISVHKARFTLSLFHINRATVLTYDLAGAACRRLIADNFSNIQTGPIMS